MVERDPLTAIFRLIGVSSSLVGIWKVETHFPEMRLSPMVPVSNRAFALCPLTVIYASRALFLFPDGPTWLDGLVTSMVWLVSSWVW